MKYAWIQQHKGYFSTHLMCQMMNVCRSAFYAWKNTPISEKATQDKVLVDLIKTSFNEGRGNYGTRRIQQDLLSQKLTVSRRRIGRLMASEGL